MSDRVGRWSLMATDVLFGMPKDYRYWPMTAEYLDENRNLIGPR